MRESNERFSSTLYHSKIIKFPFVPKYKDPAFLHQKYVSEGRSIAQIARSTFSSKPTVQKHLKLNGIESRAPHHNHENPAVIPFGKIKNRKNKVVTNRTEKETLETILELASKPLSLREIARKLDYMKVTPRSGKRWHPEQIRRLLSRAKTG